MYDFNPRSSYHRRMWHYESDRPLSVAQLVALGSLDARTAALLWLLIERHCSVIVSGPTDPTPGVGKTTTLNALLGFLPSGSTLVYTLGMFEEFEFLDQVQPATTCVLANEVSDHLRIYMWGRVARRFLSLPETGYAIATSCHADTVEDVLSMLLRDLRVPAATVRGLNVIVNIGLVGRLWPPRRRFLTVNFVRPQAPAQAIVSVDTADATSTDPRTPALGAASISLMPLATWEEATDSFTPATSEALTELAEILKMTPDELTAALDRRTAVMEQLAQGRGTGVGPMREAVEVLMANEAGVEPGVEPGERGTPPASSDDEDEDDDYEDDEDED